MKSNSLSLFTLLCVAAFMFTSCTKQSSEPETTTPPLATSSDDLLITDAPGLYQTVSGYKKLVLQPGDDLGQDAWIDYFNGYDSSTYNNDNSGQIDQIKCNTWTMFGGIIIERSLIKFTELSKIPAGSTVVAAKMFLYGLSSSPYHLPQGNSYYDGSPYAFSGPNDIYVQKILSPWDESSVTWNTQPSKTEIDESLISPSTSQWNYNAGTDVTKMTKDFVHNPSNNYGYMLSLVNERIYNCMGFQSSEASDSTRRPKLVIIYK